MEKGEKIWVEGRPKKVYEINSKTSGIKISAGESNKFLKKMTYEEIMGVLKKIKGGKAAGMDGIVVEMLKLELLA